MKLIVVFLLLCTQHIIGMYAPNITAAAILTKNLHTENQELKNNLQLVANSYVEQEETIKKLQQQLDKQAQQLKEYVQQLEDKEMLIQHLIKENNQKICFPGLSLSIIN